MPRVTDEYYEKKRREIIDAAYRVCVRKPITSVDMKDIIEEAGFSHGVIYRYYKELDEIIRDLVITINERNKIDARLDLHGYTLDKAFEVLKNFIHNQSRQNARCLLVITGKGGLLGRGVLKAEMPVWMNSGEIRSLVLSYTTAQPKDGGDGAFYILLKRNRT